MTPEQFNTLPLPEQLKALEPGDELHLRGGGWLPFVEYDNRASQQIIVGGNIWWDMDGYTFRANSPSMNIIRVIRPSARKVPDIDKEIAMAQIVTVLRTAADETESLALDLALNMLADHFEKEAVK